MKKINLISLTAILLLSITNSNGQTKCLIADYPLNGNATDVYAANNGALYGTAPTTDRFGRSNYALKFNGTTDWVKLGTDFDYAQRSISLWFKADTFLTGGAYGHVFATDNANFKNGACGITLDNSGGTNRINLGIGSNVKRYTNNVKKDTWYHCAIVATASQIKFYINGQLFDSATNNSTLHSGDGDTKAHLGSSRKTDRFFKGTIDDVKIYDCALSNAEINALYKIQIVCPVATYPFNGDAKDVSGNNRNSTLYGTSYAKDRSGKSNSAVHFNGTSDWIKLGTDADLPERTISLWFQVDTFIGNDDFGLVFTTDNAGLQYGGTGIAVDNYGGANRISGGVGANINRYTNAKPNTWYHYAITVGAGKIKFYLNGTLLDSMSNNSFIHSDDGDNYAHLGCSRKNDRYFKGSIDNVNIYACALSKTEIGQQYTLSTHYVANANGGFKVYPNPATDMVSIEIQGSDSKRTLKIYNMQGQMVMTEQLEKSMSNISIGHLPSGLYNIVLQNEVGSITSKLLKQ